MINKTSMEATPSLSLPVKDVMSCPKKAISFISSTSSLLFCFYLPLQLFPCNDLLDLMMAMTGPYYLYKKTNPLMSSAHHRYWTTHSTMLPAGQVTIIPYLLFADEPAPGDED